MTITKEEVQKLLDGATPGPWRADGEPWNRIVWSEADNRICFVSHSNGLNDARDIATSNLTAAAPDLAAFALAESARADQAEAAMAAVVERAADSLLECSVWCDSQERADANWHNGVVDARKHFMARIRDFAPIDGLALVRELRADADRLNRWRAEEGEKIKRQAKALTDLTKHCQRIEAENAGLARKIGKVQRGDGDHSQIADLEAKVINQRNELANLRARDGRLAELAVERDTLAAANAALEARVAELRDFIDDFAKAKIDALRYSPPCGSSPEDEPDPVVDAETVWAWQADAKAALSHIKRGKTNG